MKKKLSTKQRILIVEDHELNSKLFRDVLVSQGFEVYVIEEGELACQAAHSFKPDLILMDIQLKKMSGIEAIALLKADTLLRSIPVIAVTAFAMIEDRMRIEESGCDGYITKPIYVAAFLEQIRHTLDKKDHD